ncbi:MAG: large-conductance mechanosensitive channel protein MscL [Anaerolineae bacterium]|nr:large-conductance mechanosensitive channel protein MscL [Anaerolineae bacterium]
MWKEFQKFIMRGNVLDLAVGIIIGAAFTAIVNSLVNDIVMPPIGLLTAGVSFEDLAITLKAAEGDNPAVVMNIGLFINAIIQFLIVAFVVFLIIRAFNRMMERYAKPEEPSPEPTPDPVIISQQELTEAIKDLQAAIERRS